ncbi:hypothetical protein [Bacillus sp. FSL R12-0069]|uniref:hypothetical protein n=1 Tax=Bacillus sp. FSL R12-0069 TaxID=2975342 RepID=UPI0030FA87F0
MNWIDFFGILTWIIILGMYYRYVTKQTNTTNENRECKTVHKGTCLGIVRNGEKTDTKRKHTT